MVTAAAGSVALVAAPMIAAHGLPYLFAAGICAGVMQLLFGLFRLNAWIRFVGSPVRGGFVNSLAILIFCAQLPHLQHAHWSTWGMLALGLSIIYGLPLIPWRILQVIPSPLICIVVLTLVSNAFHFPLKTIADLGHLPDHLPHWSGWPSIPLNMESVRIFFFPALAIALVGLLESIMTAAVVDDLTQTPSSKRRECIGLGLANIVTGLFGGISGCGMIGQSVGNVRYGGRGRLSTLFAGVFLLLLMLLLRRWILQVPVVALVAVMVMVSISTFDWGSLRALFHHPRSSSSIMLFTVAGTLITQDLAIGVGIGVVFSGLFFAASLERMFTVVVKHHDGVFQIVVRGHLFFACADAFIDHVSSYDPPAGETVILDLSGVYLWDVTAVDALKTVLERFSQHSPALRLEGLTPQAQAMVRSAAPEILDVHFQGQREHPPTL